MAYPRTTAPEFFLDCFFISVTVCMVLTCISTTKEALVKPVTYFITITPIWFFIYWIGITVLFTCTNRSPMKGWVLFILIICFVSCVLVIDPSDPTDGCTWVGEFERATHEPPGGTRASPESLLAMANRWLREHRPLMFSPQGCPNIDDNQPEEQDQWWYKKADRDGMADEWVRKHGPQIEYIDSTGDKKASSRRQYIRERLRQLHREYDTTMEPKVMKEILRLRKLNREITMRELSKIIDMEKKHSTQTENPTEGSDSDGEDVFDGPTPLGPESALTGGAWREPKTHDSDLWVQGQLTGYRSPIVGSQTGIRSEDETKSTPDDGVGVPPWRTEKPSASEGIGKVDILERQDEDNFSRMLKTKEEKQSQPGPSLQSTAVTKSTETTASVPPGRGEGPSMGHVSSTVDILGREDDGTFSQMVKPKEGERTQEQSLNQFTIETTSSGETKSTEPISTVDDRAEVPIMTAERLSMGGVSDNEDMLVGGDDGTFDQMVKSKEEKPASHRPRSGPRKVNRNKGDTTERDQPSPTLLI